MLSISTGHSAGYLTGSVGAGMEGYYAGSTGSGEPAGIWNGRGAEALGLSGEVDPDVMHAIYHQFADPRDPRFADPNTRSEVTRLGRPPKNFRTPDQVVADRTEAYEQMHSQPPTPEQVHSWRIQAEADAPKAVLFLDATFSPQKSVTVLHSALARAAYEAHAAGDDAQEQFWHEKVAAIDSAIAEANQAQLDYLADHGGYARTGRHTGAAGGTGRWADAHELVVASFYQHTSRTHDPQLHMHNAILNRVECPDGTWRALDSKAMHRAIQGAGAVGSLALRTRLTEQLGVSWVPREDGHDYEIAGVDQHVMDLFSTRSKTLTRRAEELIANAEAQFGRPLNSLERYRLAKRASLATRQAKTYGGEHEAERLSKWDTQLRGEVAGGLRRLAERFRQPAAPPAEAWSQEAVIQQALEAVHGDADGVGRAVWGRPDLTRQIGLALPGNLRLDPGKSRELLERLTDAALERSILVAGREVGDIPCPDRLSDGTSAAIAPYARRYATPGHVAAETAILAAAGIRGRACVDRSAVEAWLDDGPGAGLSPAQREAVLGLASTDAALAVLVGPAGTGKSYVAGTLASSWSELTGARVIGLATAETAANVLADDGVPDSANITAFLTAQARLADNRPLPGDERWRVGPRDILLIDEASMVDTVALTRLQAIADSAGARVVMTGDPHQLAAVGAGGMMRTAIDRGAETYTLSDVRRFTADWERQASLQLRAGQEPAVAEYARHGRLRDGGRLDQTIAAVARAAAADRLAGREVLVTCGSNEHAAAVAAEIRRHLVAAGRVEEGGVVLGRDRTTAGIGDVVQARRIDRPLGLINRETYRVTGVRDDGGLDVVSTRTGAELVMPASYLATDASLAYASTAHAAQGATVDVGHLLLADPMGREALYVGLTRGREENTAWAVTESGLPDDQPTTAAGLLHRLITNDDQLAASDLSAHDHAARDEAHRNDPVTLLERIEEQTRIACRERLEADLDQLVADGALSSEDRARFGADQGTEHLSRQLRALETAGHDPAEVLRDAVTLRDYTGAVSLARATAGRIEKAYGLPAPHVDTGLPDRISDERRDYLSQLHKVLQQRQDDKGAELATDPPAWATSALGDVPDDETARAVWQEQAAGLDLARRSTGWDHEAIAVGRSPGVSTPEKRLAWSRAWTDAGMPEERRPAADLSDGQLRVRVAAGQRVLAHAPAFVHDQQARREQAASDARRDAALTEASAAADDKKTTATVQRLAGKADAIRRDADTLDEVNIERGHWLIAHAETLNTADEAREEAARRGLPIGTEPDRDIAENWLARQREADRADDAHREITDADVDDRPADLRAVQQIPTTREEGLAAIGLIDTGPTPKVSASATAVEIAAAATHAGRAAEKLADQASQDAAAPAAEEEWHLQRRAQLDQVATASASDDGATP